MTTTNVRTTVTGVRYIIGAWLALVALTLLSWWFGAQFKVLVEHAEAKVDRLRPLVIVLALAAVAGFLLYHFLRRLTADHREVGLDKPPEHFPKQADVRMCVKGMGNWLRLPGRHHKREFYSRVWDGSRWLAGGAAIDYMLALAGDDPALVPDAPPHEEHSSST